MPSSPQMQRGNGLVGTHVRPSQRLLVQHGSCNSPQASHIPAVPQIAPVLHALPGQHGSLTPPHSHLPDRQTNPGLHAPEQHGWRFAPHAWQMPVMQAVPLVVHRGAF